MIQKIFMLLDCDYDALTGDAQREIYVEFYNFAYGSVYYMVRDHAIVEDVIQESFLKVIRSIPPEMENELSFKAWMRTVVKNMTYNFLRKYKKIRNEVDMESVFQYENAEFAASSEPLQSEVEAKLMAEAVAAYLERLKPEYRAIVELRWRHELSYKEIADCLDSNEQTVKHRLYRAREAIKKQFRREWGLER